MGYQEGEVLADCPECGAENSVIYRSAGEAVCNKCGAVFEVEADEEEAPAPPPPPPEPAPTPAPQPAPDARPHVPNVVEPAVGGRLTELDTAFDTPPVQIKEEPTIDGPTMTEPVQPVINPAGTLDAAAALDKPGEDQDIPEYMKASRPWRWAHELGNTGNPYRPDTKAHAVYQSAARTNDIPGIVAYFASTWPQYADTPKYLMNLYEVISQCLTAGLLVMDPNTRIISECQGRPKPVKI